MRRISVVALTMAVCVVGAAGAGRGVLIEPDEDGRFVYADDFSTPKFLADAFLKNAGPEIWQEGAVTNRGPNRYRTLIYRFHGERLITDLSVTVQQRANARNWGGRNSLSASTNGLDWVVVASSSDQEGDANGWQTEPLTLAPEDAAQVTGATEVWLRVVMDNFSGLETIVSNTVSELRVEITVGEPPGPAGDPQAELRARWGRLREREGWRSITLDAAHPPEHRAPHYYEDADGWLVAPGEVPALDTDESGGFRLRRAYLHDRRSPLSLVAFVRTDQPRPLLARLTIRAVRDGSREMRVLWDGEQVGAFNAASYFDEDRVVFAELDRRPAGLHELRVTAGDSGAVIVREIAIAGWGGPQWAPKPELPPARGLEVVSAHYLPDPLPPADSQAVEGRQAQQEVGLIHAGLQGIYDEHEDFGALRVILRNRGRESVRVSAPIQLNGAPVEEGYVDFETDEWDARGVVWYRCRPRLIPPEQCAELYIRFRRRPEGRAASLRIPCENAPTVSVRIPYEHPAAVIDYVTTDETGERLYVYLRPMGEAVPAELSELALDGERLSDASWYGRDFRDGVALAVVELPRTLQPMSYHAVSATTLSGETVAAQFRVMPWIFPRSSIHVPSEMCDEMNMNLGMWHHRSLEDCEEHGIFTVTNTHRMFDAHERVLFIMGPDEPDAHDNRGGGYNTGLGYQARRLMDSGWPTLVRTQAPRTATWVIMNGTTRPLNWGVYGQLADIACFDPYPINFYGADHAYVRESLDFVRRCGAPRRLYACLEAFGWRKGEGVPSNRRGPIPAEYRQNVVQAIGAGMKGLTSWVYSAGAGGWQSNDLARQEIAAMNALIATVEDDLLLGCPVDWASTDAGTVDTGVVGEERWPKERVWAGALLCGPDTIVVAVANHIPASKPEPPEIQPARDLTVTVELPRYLDAVTAFEATAEGLVPAECTVDGGAAQLRLDEVESGRVFVLRRE
ncbi:MAG: hypothetical protein U9R79_07780 [Armatimonadota bacterium]|nr:hypothetical protein [Armatimonadota bacterium]